MARLWLTALTAAAVIACGGDDNGGPTDFFPDVAGTYAVQGQFDGVDPSDLSFTGTVTIEQESLESSLLTGTANLTIVSPGGNTPLNGVPLINAGVDLGATSPSSSSRRTSRGTSPAKRPATSSPVLTP